MKKRYHILDEIRGITLCSMIIYHAVWDLVYMFGRDWTWYRSDFAYIWQQSICWSFILLSGFCFSLGKKKLRRGLIVFGAGALVSLVTEIAMPANRIRFGVLTLLGSSMLIMALVERIRNCFAVGKNERSGSKKIMGNEADSREGKQSGGQSEEEQTAGQSIEGEEEQTAGQSIEGEEEQTAGQSTEGEEEQTAGQSTEGEEEQTAGQSIEGKEEQTVGQSIEDKGKLPAEWGMVFGAALFAVTKRINYGYLGFAGIRLAELPESLYQMGDFGTFLGFTESRFYSTDYFSLMPWFFLFLTGFYLHKWFVEKGWLDTLVRLPSLGKWWRLLGKHSLLIYMLHQPIIYVILLLTA